MRVATGFSLPSFLLRLLINAAALAVAAWLLPGIRIADWQSLLLAALIFGLVNAFVKPLLAFVTCPLILLTLGLFLIVINALMMGVTSWIAGELGIGFRVDNVGAALLGAVIVSIVSWVLTQITD